MDRELAKKYLAKRRRKKRAAVVSGVSAVGILILGIIAFCMMTRDRFTISTEHEPGLSLTIDESKVREVSTLNAPPLLKAADTQYSDIPEDVDEGLGSKNTDYYFAYSFYLGGSGMAGDTINYSLSFTLDQASNELEDAIKIMIIRNSQRLVYAKANEDGSPKPIYYGEDRSEPAEVIGYTIPFEDNRHIIWRIHSIKPGCYDKYTIVMWIDGWESVNSMKGGSFNANVKFSTESTTKEV